MSMLLILFHAPHKELLGKDFFVKLLSHAKTWTQDKTHPSQKGERRTLASRNILILLGLSHVPLTAQQVRRSCGRPICKITFRYFRCRILPLCHSGTD